MNKQSLEHYCKSINDLFQIPAMIYRRDTGQIESAFISYDIFTDSVLTNTRIAERYMGTSIFDDRYQVSYYISDDKIAFGCIRDNESIYSLYVGPCLLADPTEEMMKAMLTRYNSPFKDNPDKYYETIYNYIKTLPRFSFERFMWLLSFTNNCVNHDLLEEKDFHEASIFKSRIVIKPNTLETDDESHFLFDNIVQCISELKSLMLTGSTQLVQEYWLNNSPAFFHALASNETSDMMRFQKNTFIQFITYLAANVISSQISERQTYLIINELMEKVEDAIMIQQIEVLYRKAILDFTSLVYRMNNEHVSDNLLVNEAINYIHDNINRPISVNDIADSIGISRGYLSSLFNKAMNTSISDYINREKTEAAKLLLKNTDNTIADISEYLSFSSQSYFQNIFRKYAGTTPLKYRRDRQIKK